MTTAERVELVLIAILGIVVFLVADQLPSVIPFARLLLYAAALLLLQSLVRDLWWIKTHQVKPDEYKEAACICLESTIGAAGVIIGLLLIGAGFNYVLILPAWFWLVLVATVTVLGFLIKDLVLEWRPLRIRRDKNHMNIVFKL